MSKFSFDGQPNLRLLTNQQIEMIHERALYILDQTGVKFDSEEALKILKENGADVDFVHQIVKFPPQMVIDALQRVPETIQLYDREGNLSVKLGGNRSHFDPGSSPMNFMEADGITVRLAKAEDLVKISRVNDSLSNIELQSTSVVLDDIPQQIGDSYRLYLLLKTSPKPCISGAFSVHGISDMRELLAAVVGGYELLKQKPITVFDICPSPPLKWTHVSSQNIIDCAKFGLPMETISVPMPGAVSPATLAGSVLIHTAETLSGIVLAQCVNPGTPVVYGGAPMYFDMRQSTTSLNSIETNLISTAYSQMGKYYGLPTHTYAGLSDSKMVDAQAGLESGMSGTIASLSGINVISGVGVMEFCNTFSIEKLVLDNEICGMALKYGQGIDCSEEAFALDLISELGPGGDYMSSEHTFKWFKKVPYLPSRVIDRSMRQQWEARGSLSAFTRAQQQVVKILETHQPRALEAERARELDNAMLKIMKDQEVSSDLPFGPA